MTPALETVSHLFTTSERLIAEILGHLDEKSLHFRPSEDLARMQGKLPNVGHLG